MTQGSICRISLDEAGGTLGKWWSDAEQVDFFRIIQLHSRVLDAQIYAYKLDTGEIAGGCCLIELTSVDQRFAAGCWLYVDPQYRNRGIASQLRQFRRELCERQQLNYVIRSVEQEIDANSRQGFNHRGDWFTFGFIAVSQQSIEQFETIASTCGIADCPISKLTTEVVDSEAFRLFDASISGCDRQRYFREALTTDDHDIRIDAFCATAADSSRNDAVLGFVFSTYNRRFDNSLVTSCLAQNNAIAAALFRYVMKVDLEQFGAGHKVFMILNTDSNQLGKAIGEWSTFHGTMRAQEMATRCLITNVEREKVLCHTDGSALIA